MRTSKWPGSFPGVVKGLEGGGMKWKFHMAPVAMFDIVAMVDRFGHRPLRCVERFKFLANRKLESSNPEN
jgi:hypothetical protein